MNFLISLGCCRPLLCFDEVSGLPNPRAVWSYLGTSGLLLDLIWAINGCFQKLLNFVGTSRGIISRFRELCIFRENWHIVRERFMFSHGKWWFREISVSFKKYHFSEISCFCCGKRFLFCDTSMSCRKESFREFSASYGKHRFHKISSIYAERDSYSARFAVPTRNFNSEKFWFPAEKVSSRDSNICCGRRILFREIGRFLEKFNLFRGFLHRINSKGFFLRQLKPFLQQCHPLHRNDNFSVFEGILRDFNPLAHEGLHIVGARLA